VSWNPYPPLPVAAIRDLSGLVRVMYRAAAAEEDAARLEALASIGGSLRFALRGAGAHPGTIAHLDAWAAAERAARALEQLVKGTPLAPLVAATSGRISRPGSMA
jgi:hypothetical protein